MKGGSRPPFRLPVGSTKRKKADPPWNIEDRPVRALGGGGDIDPALFFFGPTSRDIEPTALGGFLRGLSYLGL